MSGYDADKKTCERKQKNRDAETWRVAVDWPVGIPVDLTFAWKNLDVFDVLAARPAFSRPWAGTGSARTAHSPAEET
ncbi:hypothetical protein [Azospirillum soli]|uniref:hypothetical protein n=1 Tax=Azospirillum soli TaxID=1304799 RepID=UPI001FE93348|nr:hypothetical protein [Azospirillum soli]MBP2315695.1 hypothetical protein [Azospirillum soli]